MKKYFNKLDKLSWIVLTFFVVLLLFGLCTFRDYGMSWDETIQRHHTLVTYKYLVPSVRDIVTDSVDFSQIPELKDYGGGSAYGVLLQLPTVLLEHLFGFRLTFPQIFKMRHLYVFLWFFLASITFYQSCKIIFKDRRYAMAGVLMYVLAPRILADAFYNVKDLLSLSCATVAIYCSLLFLTKKSIVTFALCIFVSVMAITSRIVNAVIVAGVVIVVFLQMCCAGKGKKAILFAVGSVVGMLGIYIAITPSLWENTFVNLWNTIKTMANYTTWSGYMLFMGEELWGHELPWYYLFVWITVTTPIFYIAYMCWGTLVSCFQVGKNLFKNRMTEYNWAQVFVGCITVAPFLYVALFHPVLYNGWRHFYFIYAQLVLVALFGIHHLLEQKAFLLRTGVVASLVGTFVLTAYWIVDNSPYGYLYFNKVFESYAEEHFEKDYWHSTQYAGLNYICSTDDRDSIKVVMGIDTPLYMLSAENRERIDWVDDNARTDYYIKRYVTSPMIERLTEYYLFEDVFEVKTGNLVAQTTFKESYDLSSDGVLRWEGQKMFASINGDQWLFKEDKDQVYLDLEVPWAIPLARVFLKVDGVEKESVNVLVSEDAENWIDITTSEREVEWEGELNFTIEEVWTRYVRLVIPQKAWSENGTIEYKLMQTNGYELLNNTRVPVESITSTALEPVHWLLLDNDYTTRWTTGDSQVSGDYVELIYKDDHYFSGVRLDTSLSPWDAPVNLIIYVSDNGQQWMPVTMTESDDGTYLFETIRGKGIRLEIGSLDETVRSNWSIYELEIYEKID